MRLILLLLLALVVADGDVEVKGHRPLREADPHKRVALAGRVLQAQHKVAAAVAGLLHRDVRLPRGHGGHPKQLAAAQGWDGQVRAR